MSLLSPFNFGQKHSYFHVQLTIHELDNVPLVTGLFACKWKIKGSHSLASLQHSAAAAVHQGTSRIVSGAARKPPSISSAKEANKDVKATDHESDPANKGSTHVSTASNADASEADTSSPTSRRDSTTSRKTTNSRPKSLKDIGRHKSSESHNHTHDVDPLLFFSQEPKGETHFVKVADHKVEWERDVQVGMRIGIGKPRTSGPNDSKTNATVKLTVSMTFLGGEREYYVPPISNGLMVNGLRSIMAPSLLDASHDTATAASPSKSSSSGNVSSNSSDSLANEPIRANASIRNRELMGQGLPSASSLSLNRLNSYGQSRHNFQGPPSKYVYTKKTWTNRIPEDNLVAPDKVASGSEGAKKKPHRTAEASIFSARNQGDRAPEDLVDAIFKGIPVGGSHNGLAQDEAAAAKAAAARGGRGEHAANATDSLDGQLRRRASRSPERTRDRRRTISSASQRPKKPERTFSFGLGFSSKDKDKGKDKAKDKKCGIKNNKSGSTTDLESLAGDRPRSTHLTVPGSDTGKPLVESPSASTDALQRTNSEAAIPTRPRAVSRSSFRRFSAVRWKLGGDEPDEPDPSSQDTTPVAETFDSKEQRDRAAMPPPPSVVVAPHIPIRAAGIAASSVAALHKTEAETNGLKEGPATDTEIKAAEAPGKAMLSPPIVSTSADPASSKAASIKGADAASIRSFSSTTSAAGPGKKVSSNDLKSVYEAGLSIPQSLSNSTSVGLDRLKRTSRAIGQFAKDAARSTRSASRPSSSSGAVPLRDSEGVSGRERLSKGNHGIEPSEAASKGWRGAGWLRPISTAPAPLPPCSPDLSSGSEDGEFEDTDDLNASVDLAASRSSNNSEDGRRSSNTDQTVMSDTIDTPPATKYGSVRPSRKREPSIASVYHDADETPDLVGTEAF
uniref:C2 NT-type domain-containing protein n=1 Tax=Kalmanozyma brasiliensis (strain GHG001) TaxID=1365824 RepID=V5E486_KALBG